MEDGPVIKEPPLKFLQSVGSVFVEFDGQDSGNVSYGVQIEGKRFFVKTAGDPDDPKPFLEHAARVELLRNAVVLGRTFNHPASPPLERVVESTIGPVLFYRWFDGELLHSAEADRNDPACAFQRFRRLPTLLIQQCLDSVFALHVDLAEAGWIAVDFYDGSLLYDFENQRIGVVDMDNYRQGPFRNEMGRMFGSSRFMAPEELQLGARIDQRTNVFTMGRAALVFLSDGTRSRDAFRGSTALFDVVSKAVSLERFDRFESMASFFAAWSAARSRY